MPRALLHAVLNMPPRIWGNTQPDLNGRHARYKEASQLILSQSSRIEELEDEVLSLNNELHKAKEIAKNREKSGLKSMLEWLTRRAVA